MKRFFFSRLMRERLLMVLLVLGGAAVVLQTTLKAVREFIALDSRINGELARQRAVLAERPLIEARTEAAAQRFDPSRTFDSLRLASEVDAMTRAAGIKASSTGDANTAQGPQFSLHSLQLTLRNTDYASLVKLYSEVSRRSPYISIDQLSISANAGNPALLNASWRLSSVEVARR